MSPVLLDLASNSAKLINWSGFLNLQALAPVEKEAMVSGDQ
jgi:hypothetical protein